MNGANVKGETVPDCGASEGEGPFSESLTVFAGDLCVERKCALKNNIKKRLWQCILHKNVLS